MERPISEKEPIKSCNKRDMELQRVPFIHYFRKGFNKIQE